MTFSFNVGLFKTMEMSVLCFITVLDGNGYRDYYPSVRDIDSRFLERLRGSF